MKWWSAVLAGHVFFLWVFLGKAEGQPISSVIRGIVVHPETGMPFPDVSVKVPLLKKETASDAAGRFYLTDILPGSYFLHFSIPGFQSLQQKIYVLTDSLDVGVIRMGQQLGAEEEWPLPVVVNIDPVDAETDGSASGHSSGDVLAASPDLFMRTASFTWGSHGFRPRGYPASMQQVWLNGLPMHDKLTQNSPWQLWSGLNDIFKEDHAIYGLQAPDVQLGGLNGYRSFSAAAADFRRQVKITYSHSNRQYKNRLMLTCHSGWTDKNWAFSFSLSQREGAEGNKDGIFYRSFSAFASVSKIIRNRILSVSVFSNLLQRAGSSAVTREVIALAGTDRYNPDWGYQSGQVRNARVVNQHMPVWIVSWAGRSDVPSGWALAAGFQAGSVSRSSLDWYRGKDPRPDYYRYLPSWQYYQQDPALAEAEAENIRLQWQQDPSVSQINWDRLYEVNRQNQEVFMNVNGIRGNHLYGNRSVYVVSSDVCDVRKAHVGMRWVKQTLRNAVVHHGIYASHQQLDFYKRLDDLLDGDFFVNYNPFAEQYMVPERAWHQRDLRHPDRIVRTGEKYQYHYQIFHTYLSLWMHGRVKFRKIEAFLGGSADVHLIRRFGNYQNGLYVSESYGWSPPVHFIPRTVKAGLKWNISGKYDAYLNGLSGREMPRINNVFIMPKYRHSVVPGIVEEKFLSAEGGIRIRTPLLHGKVSGYFTERTNITEIRTFYNDDPLFRSFVNYVLTDVCIRHAGWELAGELQISDALRLRMTVAQSQVYYQGNPDVWVYRDNDTQTAATPRKVYIDQYFTGSGPQQAYNLGISWRKYKYGYLHIDASWLDGHYVSVSPDRRTTAATEPVLGNPELLDEILEQEKLPAFFTIDLFAGKSFALSRAFRQKKTDLFFSISVGVSNVLNKKNRLSAGYEQWRFDFTDHRPDKFPSKYYSGAGRTYFLNFSLRW